MDSAGAYGAGKAGGAFDPYTFIQRPQVMVKSVCLLFGIIVWGCISSGGYMYDKKLDKEVCLYNRDASACTFGSGIGFLGLLAAGGFIAGEYFFTQMSSVKTRKHFVLGDLGFSGAWAFLYFISFCYLANQWSDMDALPEDVGTGNVFAAIVFSFFSIFSWAGAAWFAYQRFKQGVDPAFASTYEADQAQYSSYPDAEGGYQEPPFSGNQNQGGGDYQAPAY
ncbi:unnamed protein product [Bemisia tabaci]|uniref:Synaptogyrin n=1 Tax=Bemisia tabaci TaxID=7038 RepID=A0A9P0F6W0_BEMTA|nr:PREDICTED: synaptogyrin-1 [Bemisia tabaci]CAH0390442.1 unnamed protein product [Bemisia tabaci]